MSHEQLHQLIREAHDPSASLRLRLTDLRIQPYVSRAALRAPAVATRVLAALRSAPRRGPPIHHISSEHDESCRKRIVDDDLRCHRHRNKHLALKVAESLSSGTDALLQ